MCLSRKSPITNCVAIPGRPPSLYSGAISPSMNSQSILPASCTSSCLMLMIWSSRARNRSADPVVSCFFGRIAPSDAATESCFSIRGNRENEFASFHGLRHGNLAISSQQSCPKATLAQWVSNSSRATMEDVLAVYTRPRDGDCPLVCLDETSKQLIAETRVPISMKAGRPARFDYEYERNGTANLFMMFAPLEGWRHVKVTDRHTAVDYARVLKDLADIHFAHAKTIVLVQDNLSIHSKASLYEALSGRRSQTPGRALRMAL